MSAMKSETLTTAEIKEEKQSATSSVQVTPSGDLITALPGEETEEEAGSTLLERIINEPYAAKSKKDEDDDDDDDDFDDDDDDDFDDDFEEEEIDEDFEEFDMPKSKPGAAGAGKKKGEDDDFELEDDFDDFDDFDDDDDDDF